MFRQIWYTAEQLRGYDLVTGATSAMIALCRAVEAVLGGQTAVAWGLTANGNGTNLNVGFTEGGIFQLADIDATTAGLITQNVAQVLQQGTVGASIITLSTAGISGGQSRYTLVQAQFNQQDVIPGSDPTNGNLPFYNSANPAMPIFATDNTQRQGVVTIGLKNGTAAATGTEVPPSADAGWVGLYLIDLAFGQTTLTTGQILVAGPSVGTNVPNNYPGAPFLAGLLNSHHGGTPGQAPKIFLTSEVQGILPLANLPSSARGGNYGGATIYTAPHTVLPAEFGNFLVYGAAASGAGNFGITDATANGTALAFENNSFFANTINIAVGSVGTFNGNGLSGASSFVLQPGQSAIIVWVGGNWFVLYWSAADRGSMAGTTIYTANHVILTSEFGRDIIMGATASSNVTMAIPDGTTDGQLLGLRNNNASFNLIFTQASGATGTYNGWGLLAATSVSLTPEQNVLLEWSTAAHAWFVQGLSSAFDTAGAAAAVETALQTYGAIGSYLVFGQAGSSFPTGGTTYAGSTFTGLGLSGTWRNMNSVGLQTFGGSPGWGALYVRIA